MRAALFSFFVLALITLSVSAQALTAKETDFLITVKAKDAKFIGTAAGGAQIIIKNRLTGDTLASGVTYGGTGDTDKIMADDIKRDAVIVDENTAKLEFSLEFWEPTPVTIIAKAPLGQAQSMVTVSRDMLLIPGKDYASGNGIMIEIPGLSVDVISPTPNSRFPFDPNVPVTIEANVMELCGCLIEEGSPWPPERFEVEAHVYKGGLYITSITLPYSNEPSIYGTNLKVPVPGHFRIHVTAFDTVTKEAGMDTTTVYLDTPDEE